MSQSQYSTESANISTLFREPITRENPKQDAQSVQRVDTSTGQPTTSSTESLPNPKELVELGRKPYVTELLKAEPAYDTFDVKEQLKEIDAYLQADTRKEYEKNFEELKAYIKEDDIYLTIEQIRDFVRIQQKIKDVIKEKKEFSEKDPLEMSASQLARYFKEHDADRY